MGRALDDFYFNNNFLISISGYMQSNFKTVDNSLF